jgi:dienelactone hydrolase
MRSVAAVAALWLALVFCTPVVAQKPVPVLKIEERVFSYTSDGLKVRGRLVLPASGGPYPGVVYGHGGTSGLTAAALERCRDLARAGYVVVAPSYRGEDGSEGEIEVAAGEVNDTLNALYWLKAQNTLATRLDSNRIALVGTSHGALVSLLAANRLGKAAEQQGVRALVFAYGVADLYSWYDYLKKTKQLGGDGLTERIYGKGPQDKPENFRIRHGLGQTKSIAVPVLILQGAKDTVVPATQAQALHQTLQRQGQTSTLKLYPTSEHAFLVSRGAIINQYSEKSMQYKESLLAWNDMLEFLTLQLNKK